jgi:hypothetical protein
VTSRRRRAARRRGSSRRGALRLPRDLRRRGRCMRDCSRVKLGRPASRRRSRRRRPPGGGRADVSGGEFGVAVGDVGAAACAQPQALPSHVPTARMPSHLNSTQGRSPHLRAAAAASAGVVDTASIGASGPLAVRAGARCPARAARPAASRHPSCGAGATATSPEPAVRIRAIRTRPSGPPAGR